MQQDSQPTRASSTSPAPGGRPPSLHRKTVSLPPEPAANGPVSHSPAHEKILSRKPTPFNSDLAAAIKRSGLNALINEYNKSEQLTSDEPSSKPDVDSDANHNESEEKQSANGHVRFQDPSDTPSTTPSTMGTNDEKPTEES